MIRFRARLALFAMMAIFLATAGNALFLQDRARLFDPNGLPSTSVSVTQFPHDKASPVAPALSGGDIKQVSLPTVKGPRMHVALYRELGQRGYSEQLQHGENGLRLAVLAYQFDNAMPLTGEPTEALLKRVLFDTNHGPHGAFADRAELNPKLVVETQKALLGLGFFRGTFSGRLDVWTSNAIKDFERHRGIPVTGRLTDETLLELIAFSGQPMLPAAG
ncbi:peptidoglycan-binding domain-containing protein [Rhodomicrobium sp.]|jgi:hypothetical protein|uniref:peptidoglycan-binding domain-containing protein n=1 Tax=Rhodomicrobium sp. TaxID=2720632 RepID=UPI0039E360F5